ncbi:MAG TPA: YbjN domain-containing protein [Bacteroidota bacterium]|nr:YbjN domain-containing protein [Bacteroidota bacterium]
MSENIEKITDSNKKLNTYYSMVDDVIYSLGLNVTESRKDKGKWAFYRGSALVKIEVYHSKPNDENYIHIYSPIMKVPKKDNEKFYKRLLEINNKLFQSAFSIKDGVAILRIIRECTNLDSKEIENMIQRIGYYADEYDDLLKEEFNK